MTSLAFWIIGAYLAITGGGWLMAAGIAAQEEDASSCSSAFWIGVTTLILAGLCVRLA